MASSRKNRNYKERRPMFAFGQLVLPLAAIIAIGLLFMAVKLLFLSPNENKNAGIEFSPQKSLDESISHDVQSGSRISGSIAIKSAEKTGKTNISLAGPVDISDDGAPSNLSSDADAKKNKSTQPKEEQKPKKKDKPNDPKKVTKSDSAKLENKKESQTSEQKTGAVSKVPGKNETNDARKQEKGKDPVKKTTPTNEKVVQKPKTEKQETTNAVNPSIGDKKRSWGVQIGSFSKKEGAETLLQQAKKDGFNPVISQHAVNGVPFFRVRVSAGADRQKADQMAETLQKKGYPVSVIPLN